MSTDPALGDYIPSAPVNEEAKKANGNLPGMGGVYNTVNFHLYHYAGNNPVKYTDPTGRNSEDFLDNLQNKINEAIESSKVEIKNLVESGSIRGAVNILKGSVAGVGLTLDLVAEVDGEGKSTIKLVAGADITIAGNDNTKITIGLRQSFNIYNSESGEAIWDSNNIVSHIGSLSLAADGKVHLSDNVSGTVHARKYLTNFANMNLNSKGLKDLAFKDWIVGYQYSVDSLKGAGRFNISKWLGND